MHCQFVVLTSAITSLIFSSALLSFTYVIVMRETITTAVYRGSTVFCAQKRLALHRTLTVTSLTSSFEGWCLSLLVTRWSSRECAAPVLKHVLQAILNRSETLDTPTEMLSHLKGYQPLVRAWLVSTAVTLPKHSLHQILDE